MRRCPNSSGRRTTRFLVHCDGRSDTNRLRASDRERGPAAAKGRGGSMVSGVEGRAILSAAGVYAGLTPRDLYPLKLPTASCSVS